MLGKRHAGHMSAACMLVLLHVWLAAARRLSGEHDWLGRGYLKHDAAADCKARCGSRFGDQGISTCANLSENSTRCTYCGPSRCEDVVVSTGPLVSDTVWVPVAVSEAEVAENAASSEGSAALSGDPDETNNGRCTHDCPPTQENKPLRNCAILPAHRLMRCTYCDTNYHGCSHVLMARAQLVKKEDGGISS